MAQADHFYVTTPIYYVTAKPHLGSLYSTLLADVAARWQKIQGKKTFFLTGTDEHGQKIAQAAQQAGKDPQSFVDHFIPAYQKVWREYDIAYDYFMRTTEYEHVRAVQKWITQLLESGDIYKSFYTGWYCTPCETYVTEKDEQVQGEAHLCPSCGRTTQLVSEEAYFFKLSAYQDKLLAFYEQHPHFITPKERLNEVISFVKAGLKDLSISRTTVSWGIPFPGDEKHTVYVWADALNNYITAIGWGQPGRQAVFDAWWPASLQIMGKDIVRFHAVYWPAFLMAIGLPLPKKLLVHGWIKVGDQKMSKSLGNAIDPQVLYEQYGADAVRYYLMRHLAITQDSSFSVADLEQAIGSELANDLGNLLNRTLTLAEKNGMMQVAADQLLDGPTLALRDECWTMIDEYAQHMNDSLFHLALARLWRFINQTNSYFHAREPWKLAKNDKKAFEQTIFATCQSLYTIALLLWPVMPKKMEQLLVSLGVTWQLPHNYLEHLQSDRWSHHFMLHKSETLFAKPEPKEKEAAAAPAAHEPSYITIDDFAKVELVVGTVTECQLVEKSEKLYRLQVDFGPLGKRQILSGVRQSYGVDELVGKQGIFVLNLKPRMMAGFESQGMFLFAKDETGKAIMTTVSSNVPNGTKVT
jgi:methionyl-tRNA synthetase